MHWLCEEVMKSKKISNPDGSTKKIVVQHDSGSYSAYTPKQAAQMINTLKKELWRGIPIERDFA